MSSMKPDAAAAHPEYELSIEMTTGMSAPPMAATRWKPSQSASTVMITSGIRECVEQYQTPKSTMTIALTRLSRCRPGSMRGFEFIFPFSFAHATIEPVKVTAPIRTPR